MDTPLQDKQNLTAAKTTDPSSSSSRCVCVLLLHTPLLKKGRGKFMQTSYVEGKCKKIYGRIHMISASSDTWERSCLFNIALTNQPATTIFSYFHLFLKIQLSLQQMQYFEHRESKCLSQLLLSPKNISRCDAYFLSLNVAKQSFKKVMRYYLKKSKRSLL